MADEVVERDRRGLRRRIRDMEGRGGRWEVGKRPESRMMESKHDDTAHGKQADSLRISIYY